MLARSFHLLCGCLFVFLKINSLPESKTRSAGARNEINLHSVDETGHATVQPTTPLFSSTKWIQKKINTVPKLRLTRSRPERKKKHSATCVTLANSFRDEEEMFIVRLCCQLNKRRSNDEKNAVMKKEAAAFYFSNSSVELVSFFTCFDCSRFFFVVSFDLIRAITGWIKAWPREIQRPDGMSLLVIDPHRIENRDAVSAALFFVLLFEEIPGAGAKSTTAMFSFFLTIRGAFFNWMTQLRDRSSFKTRKQTALAFFLTVKARTETTNENVSPGQFVIPWLFTSPAVTNYSASVQTAIGTALWLRPFEFVSFVLFSWSAPPRNGPRSIKSRRWRTLLRLYC